MVMTPYDSPFPVFECLGMGPAVSSSPSDDPSQGVYHQDEGFHPALGLPFPRINLVIFPVFQRGDVGHNHIGPGQKRFLSPLGIQHARGRGRRQMGVSGHAVVLSRKLKRRPGKGGTSRKNNVPYGFCHFSGGLALSFILYPFSRFSKRKMDFPGRQQDRFGEWKIFPAPESQAFLANRFLTRSTAALISSLRNR